MMGNKTMSLALMAYCPRVLPKKKRRLIAQGHVGPKGVDM